MSRDARECMVRKEIGATLIEVLVAVAVASVGLLGLGGLMVTSNRINQDAYQHSQVNLIAERFIESVRINPEGVRSGRYSGIPIDRPAGPDCFDQGCTVDDRATFDLDQLVTTLRATLPDAQASIDCQPDSFSAGASGSRCRLAMSWLERPGTSDGSAQRRLVWIFKS